MTIGVTARIFLAIFIFGLCLYFFIDKHNDLTKLRIEIPRLAKELNTLQEQNKQLQYEIDKFENPAHLIELSHKPEYGHLTHPLVKDIVIVEEGAVVPFRDKQAPLCQGRLHSPPKQLSEGS